MTFLGGNFPSAHWLQSLHTQLNRTSFPGVRGSPGASFHIQASSPDSPISPHWMPRGLPASLFSNKACGFALSLFLSIPSSLLFLSTQQGPLWASRWRAPQAALGSALPGVAWGGVGKCIGVSWAVRGLGHYTEATHVEGEGTDCSGWER